MLKMALIGLLGVGAQWVAWRTGKPAIVLMLIAGIIAGPVLGWIVPERDFGDLQEPIIKLAVAVILFAAGLSLNFRDLRLAGPAVRSEEHTSEVQSLMSIAYAVLCLKQKNTLPKI